MIRILFFLLVVFGLGLGFAWLADRPGDMVISFDGYQYQVSLMVAAVAIAAVVATVMIVWWLTKIVWNSPYLVARYFRVRRRDRGYQALSTGMIAAGAGDAVLARNMNKQAAKLINSDQEPLIHLLEAQASILEGDHEAARKKFEAMLDDPEMRLLGLRGLYLEAERLGERDVSRHYAARAAELAPQLGWAAEATLDDKAERGDWDGALRLVDAQRSSKQVDKDAAARRRAVLLTAKAMALAETDRNAARAAAIEANRLQPYFAPAAIAAAKAYFAQNDVRKGARILEAAWKAEPHPEIADLYIHARPGDAVGDRLQRAKKLQSLRQNNAESALAVARAALDAGDFKLARAEAASAVRLHPQERAYLLLADIEEAESGDQGRIRQWLAKAVRAPRDPAWVADGYVSDRWAATSPVTGRLDAFEWKVPVERLGQLIEQDDERARTPALPVQALEPVEPVSPVPTPATAGATPTAGPREAPDTLDETGRLGPVQPSQTPAAPAMQAAADTTAMPVPPDAADNLPRAVGFEPARPPDDPGVDSAEANDNTPRKFRLF
ncbi:heme biosynthesis protein HemY [Arvimicrobium flavum]|uniref:heme biosynthesis protein HemY n=1 Tax=Arvimicrobium flavum TaxID=3393320 RepID=UPI00237C3ED5|nr:heme biosynthesis protein HemY [Mesorhizobium shangrilense]